ncbi:MAG: hypothetical protein U9R27_11390 [Campylobacterota bacterium]|nr:hypothetical protein [Campylobacterota bacterium]
MDIDNASIVDVENATVEFTKGTIGTIPTYCFDTSKGGHPMVNAMAGLAILEDDDQLIMINHCAPTGLFPKIENEFDYAHQELPNGLTQIVFTKKHDAQSTTDFSATSCGGGCG